MCKVHYFTQCNYNVTFSIVLHGHCVSCNGQDYVNTADESSWESFDGETDRLPGADLLWGILSTSLRKNLCTHAFQGKYGGLVGGHWCVYTGHASSEKQDFT